MKVEKLPFLFLLFSFFSSGVYAQVASDANSPEHEITTNTYINYSKPETFGINGKVLTAKIDAIAEEAITAQATPGAVVLVVKDNHIVFEKA